MTMANGDPTARAAGIRALALLRDRMSDRLVGIRGKRGTAGDPGVSRLADSFDSFATTIQTRMDSGPLGDGLGGGSLERRVDRAIAQVLGGGAMRGPGGFTRALQEVFPVGPDGTVATTPARGLVPLYAAASPGGYPGGPVAMGGAYAAGAGAAASPVATAVEGGAITPEQAVLYRQASLVAADVLPVLRALQPRSETVDPDQVEKVRGMVELEVRGLVEEFGRLDGPREQRVEFYLDALLGPGEATGHVGDFVRLLVAADVSKDYTSLDEQKEKANRELLRRQVRNLKAAWEDYKAAVPPPAAGKPGTFSERVVEANQLLAAVAETNGNLLAAMDAIGFTVAERRISRIAAGVPALTTLGDRGLAPSTIVVNDLTDWIEKYATNQGPYLVDALGQPGLDLVTDEAAVLFAIVASIVIQLLAVELGIDATTPSVPPELSDERVQDELEDLLSELKRLAGLAGLAA